MKNLYLIAFLFFFFGAKSHAQECSGLKEGTFEESTEIGVVRIERYSGYQLETHFASKSVYLLKITGSGCDYKLELVKVVKQGSLPPAPAGMTVYATFDRVDENTYHYVSTVDDMDDKVEGTHTKVSDGISPEFRKILSELK